MSSRLLLGSASSERLGIFPYRFRNLVQPIGFRSAIVIRKGEDRRPRHPCTRVARTGGPSVLLAQAGNIEPIREGVCDGFHWFGRTVVYDDDLEGFVPRRAERFEAPCQLPRAIIRWER